jgi:hypothetical protein
MVNELSFREAGVPERNAFDHKTIGYDMQGKHLLLACEKCHKNAELRLLPPGGRRFLGLDRSCATCHEDVHKGAMGQKCASCHGQEAWDRLQSEGHEKHLALVGGHGRIECRACHAQDDPIHSLEAIGAGRELFPRDCAHCHDSPHRGEFSEGNAALASMQPGAGCVVCHAADHATFREEALKAMTPAQHARSGFALAAPHDKASCVDCHAVPKEREDTFEARYPGRAGDLRCVACHEDVHKGQFAEGPFAAAGCVGCHDRDRFEPHAFTLEKHAKAALPLDGRHTQIACEECHKVAAETEPRVFRGTARLCEGCHEDAHGGAFGAFAAELATEALGTCKRCHLTTAFRELPPHGFDHGKWTAFSLAGAHAQSACETCHRRTEKPDLAGRTFGRVADRYGKVKGCITCHEDPHRGGFDKKGLPAHVDGKTGCARCHVETSFRVFPDGFDHGKWTGWVLDGAHEKASCAACHPPMRRPDSFGRTWGRAKGTKCAECHADVHAGQFAVDGRNDCMRCHRSATAWKDLSFRHNFDARFALGKAHASVACSACHKKVVVGDVEVVRYRPVPRECADCHTPDELKRARGRDK